MATKNTPGKYDCHGSADRDEPLFTLIARDDCMPALIMLWIAMKAGDWKAFMKAAVFANGVMAMRRMKGKKPNLAKLQEALTCAKAAEAWKLANPSA